MAQEKQCQLANAGKVIYMLGTQQKVISLKEPGLSPDRTSQDELAKGKKNFKKTE